MASLSQDVRFSFKLMRKYRGLTVLAVSALVVGIGLNTAMFSVVNAILLRPLPYPDAAKLFMVQTTSPVSVLPVSYSDFLDWKKQARSFSGMAALRITSFNLTGDGIPERVAIKLTSASYFSTLGIIPFLGRDFNDQDDQPGTRRVAIISYGLWERKFGKSPSVLGRVLVLDNQPYEIVGVAPPAMAIQRMDVWIPIGLFTDSYYLDRSHRFSSVTARLASGTSEAQAEAEMRTIAGRLAKQFPESNLYAGAKMVGISELWLGGIKKPLYLLWAGSGAILLLACVSIAAVFVATISDRRRELIIRLALGASRALLVRQLFIQMLLFALIGSLAGFAFAWAGVKMILVVSANSVPRLGETTFDVNVLWFTVALVFIVTFLAVTPPAIHIGRLKIEETIKDASSKSGSSRSTVVGQRMLITVQVALATALSLISGLFIKSLYKVTNVDSGYDTKQVLAFRVSLPKARYQEPHSIDSFYDRLIADIKTIPGVRSASAVSNLPLTGDYYYIGFETEDHPATPGKPKPFVDNLVISPGYFNTLRVQLLQGRDFTASDTLDGHKVVIVDDVLAAKYWPGENPVGKHVKLMADASGPFPSFEVVGVVHQVKQYGPEQAVPRLQVYTPLAQRPNPTMSVVMSFGSDEAGIRQAVVKKAYEIDKDIPLYGFRRLDDLYAEATGSRKLSVGLVGSFAAISVVLSIIGIYGIVSNSVVRRRREMAIRLALGATFSRAIALVATPILLCSAAGIAAGAVLVAVLTKVISAFLFEVSAHDAKVLAGAVATVILAVLAASLIPSLKIRFVNPQEILRE